MRARVVALRVNAVYQLFAVEPDGHRAYSGELGAGDRYRRRSLARHIDIALRPSALKRRGIAEGAEVDAVGIIPSDSAESCKIRIPSGFRRR